jgi:hypothetical protein
MKTRATLFAVAMLAACALAGTANAQPTFSGRFTLPYEVHWGQAVLQAGDYTITMDRFDSAAIVRSANGRARFITAFPTSGDSLKGGCFLYITNNGGQHRVRYMNAPALGKVMIYEPVSKTEQEEIARGVGQALPVVVAAK